MLMVREMNSMMPHEGGYYHWTKQAFGPFVGFLVGWMNWVVSWVDVSIYPVYAAYYLGYFIPQLNEGMTIGETFIEPWILQWVVALVLIWVISALTVRGARFSGLTVNWMGAIMLVPLIIMSGVGIYAWITMGSSFQLTLLPGGAEVNLDSLTGAFATGLFVAMWNFMGWELPTAAGSEVVKPKRTYPMAMVLVLVAAILTYSIPTVAGLYGGAGENGRSAMWGIESDPVETEVITNTDGTTETVTTGGLGEILAESGVTDEQIASWDIGTVEEVKSLDYGWEFPDIAHAIGDKVAGKDSGLSRFLGISVTLAAVLSMIGLFIGNGLGGTRIPFALAEDGMMPRWMVKVHPRYGTPWVAIVFCGIIFSIFSLQTFAFLVVLDVFLNVMALLVQFAALWAMRLKRPDLPRQKVPGGYVGLALVTLAPAAIIGIAVYSQIVEEGFFNAVGLGLIAIVIGAVLYFPIRKIAKPGVPDVDPFHADEEEE
jgi:amino acid transporter